MAVAQGILALVKDRDATNPDPTKDAMCYKAGDFVQLFPPGTEFVTPPAEPFYLFDVTNTPLTFEQVRDRYMLSEVDPEGHPTRRRAYYINLSKINPQYRNQVLNNRWVVIPWNNLRNAVTNKATGQTE